MSWDLISFRLLFASLELVCLSLLMFLVLRFLLRTAPARTRSLLWLLVLAKPTLTLAGMTVFPVIQLVPHRAALQKNADDRPTVLLEEHEIDIDLRRAGSPRTTTSKTLALETLTVKTPPHQWRAWISRAWLLGASLFLGLACVQHLRLQRILRRSKRPTQRTRRLYRDCLRELGTTGRCAPPLRLTADLNSPALAGVMLPRVLLPLWMANESTDAQILWALKHELRHWRQLDPLAGSIRQLAQILFFFHPVVWWASCRWEEAMEMACDRSLVENRNEARSYAHELYEILLAVRERRGSSFAPNPLSATRTQIGRRIESLLQFTATSRSSRRLPLPIELGLTVVASTILLFGVDLRSVASFVPGKLVQKHLFLDLDTNHGRTEIEVLTITSPTEGVIVVHSCVTSQ